MPGDWLQKRSFFLTPLNEVLLDNCCFVAKGEQSYLLFPHGILTVRMFFSFTGPSFS